MLNRALMILAILLLPTFAFAAKTVFVDGNKTTGQRGTVVTANFLNGVNTHRHDGGAYDGAGVLDYYQDSGTPNNVVITPSPALSAHVTGMPIYVKIAAANTGAATLTVGSLPAVSLLRVDGTPLQTGDLSAGLMTIVSYDGAGYRLLAPMPGSSSNRGNTMVVRDAAGAFSAGIITGTLYGTASNANTLSGDRIVRGYVTASGAIGEGASNFTVSHTATGIYRFVYTTGFSTSSIPQVAVTPIVTDDGGTSGRYTAAYAGGGPYNFAVYTYGPSGALADCNFSFIAVGRN